MTSEILHNLRHDFSWRAWMQFIGGAVMMAVLTTWLESGPALVVRDDKRSQVIVSGTDVTVQVDLIRDRTPCEGAYSVRKMQRYWDAARTRVRDVAFLVERDLATRLTGKQSYTLHAHLRSPLLGDGWFYVVEVHDNCGFLAHLFESRPSVAPPAPVTILR